MKRLSALLLSLALTASLCACGGGSAETPAPAESKTPDAATTESTAPAAPAVVKDTAILATSGEPYRFFAQSSSSCGGDDNLVLSNVYDCLLLLEADGSLSPALAESYEVSEDGLCYTFHLRSGVKFHNGEEMTAEDVKFTFDKGFEGPIGTALFVNYDHCDIVDEHTVNIFLSSPYAAFPYGVASRLGGIACKSYFDEVGEEGYMANPIGTGPYKFVEYVSGDHTTLVANEDYWRGEPPIKNIIIQTVADANTQVLGLENGDYDVIRNPAIDVCTRLDGVDGVSWDCANSTGRIVMYMATWRGAGQDLNFRKAIQCAINKEDISAAMYAGYAEPLVINMCPSYGGYPTVEDGIHVVEYDPEAAKEYLAQSNYSGEDYTITCLSGGTMETAAKVMQAQLMEIGINCKVNAVDNLSFQSVVPEREYDGYLVNDLSSLVDADGIKTHHRLDRWPSNLWYPRDEELNELFQAGAAAQGEDRIPYYVEACNIITDEAYDVPLVNDMTTVAYNSALSGVEAHCLGNYNCYFWSWNG